MVHLALKQWTRVGEDQRSGFRSDDTFILHADIERPASAWPNAERTRMMPVLLLTS